MTIRMQVYMCQICGNIVEVLHQGGGGLICCGSPMNLMEENCTDASLVKHLPVVKKTSGGIKVKVGSILHPMEETHLIEWIEIITDGKAYRHFFKPGEAPETIFPIQAEKFTVRGYCNLHRLWRA